MKSILKVILVSLLVTIGVVALFIGGMWLFGGFDIKQIYAQDLSFNVNEVISSRTFALQVDTSTPDVNMNTLILETSPGGDRIIDYPRQVTIGKPFSILPQTDATTGEINGGVVTLYARYSSASSSQSLVASCKILIDVPVKDIDISLSTNEIKVTDTLHLATAGQELTQVIKVNPTNSLLPYKSKNQLGQGADSSLASLQDKKIFMALISRETGTPDTSVVNFRTSAGKSPIIEVDYSYDDASNKLIFDSDIDIVPKGSKLGEIILRVFVCPTYNEQSLITIDNVMNSSNVVSCDESFVIRDYTVDGLNIDESDKEVYFDSPIIMYLNNEKATNGINLGVELYNNSGRVIDDYYLRNNIFINIESNVNDRLSKLDGTVAEGETNVNFEAIDASNVASWGLEYFYNDFNVYYKYKNSQKDENKIKVSVTYRDFENEYTKSFYLIPRAREVEKIDVNFEGDRQQLTFESGNNFVLSQSNFIFTYANGFSDADFKDLSYYIPFITSNQIVTIPEENGRYKLEFTITPTTSGALGEFELQNRWGSLANCIMTLTQLDMVVDYNFDASGNLTSNNEGIEFEANIPIKIEITPISKTSLNINEETILFDFYIGSQMFSINAGVVKFYTISSGSTSIYPLLSVNNVTIESEFEFDEINSSRYIRLILDAESRVVGIGSFNITAQLVYSSQSQIYLLGVSCQVPVYVYENITNLNVQGYDNGKTVLLNKNSEISENDGLTRYLFITSSQLETLRRLKDSGQLKIDFVQDFGNFNPDDYIDIEQSLSGINANAITFGEFEEVYDETGETLQGYQISYIINEIYSIKIGDVDIENRFIIRIYVDNQSGELFYGQFLFDDETTANTYDIKIKDITYNVAEIKYGDTTFGTTEDTALSLRATVRDGSIAWSVLNASGTVITSLDSLKYGFKVSSEDNNYSINGIRFNMREIDPDFTLYDVSRFYSFTPSAEGGGLSFSNVPYKEGGILLELSIFAETANDSNMYYYWNGSMFERVVNEGLQESNSAKMYFRLEGFDIKLSAQDVELNGAQGNSSTFIGNGGLFEIEGVSANVDYSVLFNVDVNSENVQISSDYSSITVLNDFLIDDGITFNFYYGSRSNVLKIYNLEDNLVDGYTVKMKGAYSIEVTKTQFDAPSSTPISDFVTVTYLSDSSDALAQGLVSLNITKHDQEGAEFVKIDSQNLNVVTFVGEYTITIRLTITKTNTNVSSSIDKQITIKSIYSTDDIIINAPSGKNGLQIQAGVTKQVEFANKLLENQAQISNISFEYLDKEEDSQINVNDLMESNFVSSTKTATFFANDINYNKQIQLIVKLSFSDGGNIIKSFDVEILSNLDFTFNHEGLTRSGDQMGINSETIVIRKNSTSLLPLDDDDLLEDNFSFELDGQPTDILYIESGEDSMRLIIGYDSNRDIIKEGSSLEITPTINFTYQTDFGYSLVFSVQLTVLILVSAN